MPHDYALSPNLLSDAEEVSLEQYFETYVHRIIQDSEILFLSEFLFPILGRRGIKHIIPQYPFIDSTGKSRRIDFALLKDRKKIAFEVNGETYHSEGIIPNEMFDDNLQRQNEIISQGWYLQRFSYTQLLDSKWRKYVMDSIHSVIWSIVPEILNADLIQPHYLQNQALEALEYYRERGWKKGIVVLPTGTGKTFLSAFDAKRICQRNECKVLFLVHRLDILKQSIGAFQKVWPDITYGILTGEEKENIYESNILFASKDTLRQPEWMYKFQPTYFNYIIVDEVHHGQAPTYRGIINYFEPKNFILGMTATPDRMDRKDIFELFEYNKIFEYSVNEAIENGFLVPYTYYGLTDNIDYTNIRYSNNKYSVRDLDRNLIIHERNEKIFEEYISKGEGNKAIGFCCSINHANRIAEFFNEKGVSAVSITSESTDRDELIEAFRRNEVSVAFTVDLFNEGVDFPNLRTLLFLRPTESKTVFFQQLGRGLRLCSGKVRVVILDFIGNYKKANNIRKFLSTSQREERNDRSGRVEKIIYEYSPGCEVHFDTEVEEILDGQDTEDRGISKEDLIDAYYNLAEEIERKPTQDDIIERGEFRFSRYLALFGSWIAFLRAIGEFTEASYHYPQGVHLGHMLYIVNVLAGGNIERSHLDSQYVRLRGNLDSGRLGTFQRQTKYKLQGLMEMGLLYDDRDLSTSEETHLELTPNGIKLHEMLHDLFQQIDLSFSESDDSIPTWRMTEHPPNFNNYIWNFITTKEEETHFLRNLFLDINAVAQMLNYLYRIERRRNIDKNSIYRGFFNAPFVKMYCDQNGIEIATEEGARHRCPFLLNILESIGIISQTRSEINVNIFLVSKHTMKLKYKETDAEINQRIQKLLQQLDGNEVEFSTEEESLLKETFGSTFLTDDYYLDTFIFLE